MDEEAIASIERREKIKNNLLKLLVATIALSLIASIGAILYFKPFSNKTPSTLTSKEYNLLCTNGYTMRLMYIKREKEGETLSEKVSITLSEGQASSTPFEMQLAPSGSGVKYQTDDKSFSLWEHNNSFTLYSGETMVTICEEGEIETFFLDGNKITLINNISEKEVAPGSVVRETIRYVEGDYFGDINGDTQEDRLFFVTQENGGTGVFYYLVAILDHTNQRIGTKATLIGDRITPKMITINNGIITVSYLDRGSDEPMTATPTLEKVLNLKIDKEFLDFGVVVENFEGEVDTSRMDLGMKQWGWVTTRYKDGREVTPAKENTFTILFANDSSASLTTDCNTLNATYTKGTSSLLFSSIISTKMFCEGSQELLFADMIQRVQGYSFTKKGELMLLLSSDGGEMLFK